MPLSTPERWRLARDVFDAALDLDRGAEREAYVRAACGADAELRAEVDAMLAADAEESSLLEDDAIELLAAVAAPAEPAPLVGRPVGPYRVLRELGRGGMGAVYLAERDDVGKRVALKVVRGELASPEHVARFLLERRALARLDHPHIAQLLDAGVTDDGTPWFAMELVEGEPITTHADRRGLGVADRLALLGQACDAVSHAHGRLLVHRDLKPSNILVSTAGEVKLVDFGIAKPLGDDAPAASLTSAGARLMTPEYAAPEQVRGEPVTTATDVYGLGAVLYELLAGRRAFDGAGLSLGEVERRVLTADPPRPSSSGRLADADLDAVVLKAMRKTPADRYASAEALAEDLRRWRDGRPVLARRGSRAYQARKFAARHRAAIAGGALLAGALAALGAREHALRGRAERLRDEARVAAAKSERVSSFLVDLFAQGDPFSADAERPDTLRLRDFLVARGGRVAALDDEPEVQRQALNVVGRMYANLGLDDSAATTLGRALALGRRLHPAGDAEALRTLSHLGALHTARLEYREGEAYLREALALGRRLYGGRPNGDVADVLHTLDDLLRQRSEYAEALPLAREEVRQRRALHGPRGVPYANALNNYGLLLSTKGDYAAAEAALREAVVIDRAALPPDHPQTASALLNLAHVLRRTGRAAAAEPLMRESLAMKRRRFGATHWRVANGMATLAVVLAELGRLDEAERLHREALAIFRGRYGERHQSVALSRRDLADVLLRRGALAEAEREARLGAETLRAVMPPGNVATGAALVTLGRVRAARGRPAAACGPGPLDEGHAMLRARLTDENVRTATAAAALGACLAARGRPEGAALLRGAVAYFRRTGRAEEPDARAAERALADAERRPARD